MNTKSLIRITCMLLLALVLVSLLACDQLNNDNPFGSPEANAELAREKVKKANEILGFAIRTALYLPDVDDGDFVDRLDDINVIRTARDLYSEALELDPDNLDASLGLAVTQILILKDDPDVQRIRDEWIDFAREDDPVNGPEIDLFKRVLPFNQQDLVLDEQTFSRSLFRTSRMLFKAPPLASEMQEVIRTSVIPSFDIAIERMNHIMSSDTASTHIVMVTSEMQGGTAAHPENPVELDQTEFKAYHGSLLSARAMFRLLLAYDFEVDVSDSTDIARALQQHSGFFTLIDAEEITAAREDLTNSANSFLDAIEFLRNETDDQDDDLITQDPEDIENPENDDLADIESGLNDFLASLSGENLTLHEDFDDNDQTEAVDLTVSVAAFFDNPPDSVKMLLPAYQLIRDEERHEDVFVWTAQTLEEWLFPDPTCGGILPGMTDAELKQIFGLNFIPGGFDVEVNVLTSLPQYSWNKGPIYDLKVYGPVMREDFETFDYIWGIAGTNHTNSIQSAVTHGVVPEGAFETFPPVGFLPQRTYEVQVMRKGNHVARYQFVTSSFIPPNPPNVAPLAQNVNVSGSARQGTVLTGNYLYSDGDNDPEGSSTFRWLRNDVAISGATLRSYTLAAADVETIIKFEVTPAAQTGVSPGTAVQSVGVGPVVALNVAPVAQNVSISGTAREGAVLTGNYLYSDVDSDPEGASTFRWLRNDVAIAGATSRSYTLTAADLETLIRFEVTPVAQSGVSPGAAARSAGVGPIEPATIENSIQVNSVPTGATIYLDGTNMDVVTNATLQNITPGNHHIRLFKAGFNEFNQNFTLEQGDSQTIDAVLGEPSAPLPFFTVQQPTNAARFNDNIITVSGKIELQASKGELSGFTGSTAILTLNGFDKEITVSNGLFNESISISAGENTLSLRANSPDGATGLSNEIVIHGDFETPDIEITLTWNTPTADLDLHVWNPLGEHSFFGNRSISDGSLDLDDVEGFGPETFTALNALTGTYVVKINSFSLDEDSFSDATVQIQLNGGPVQSFGPHRFTVADGNSNNPDAWWEVTTFTMNEGQMQLSVTPISAEMANKIRREMKSLPRKE